jgi:hypothetical protein
VNINPKGIDYYIKEILGISMFIATLFTIARIWNPPKCPSRDE